MPPIAVLLVILHAFVHAGWNLIAKRAPKSAAFYSVAIFLGVLLYSPLCAAHIASNRAILGAWPWFALSGTFLAFYYTLMAGAYARADLSIAYPLLRLAPIFITAWSVMILGEKVNNLALLGICAVVVGGVILPQQSLKFNRNTLRLKHYANRTYAAALAASLCTSVYVVADKFAMSRFNPAASGRVAFDYVWLEMAVCCVVLALIAGASGRRESWAQLRPAKLKIVLIGLMLIGAYVFVMCALAMPGVLASHVGAVRQTSVVLTVLAGIVLLKEKCGRVRILAATVIFGGLVLVVLG